MSKTCEHYLKDERERGVDACYYYPDHTVAGYLCNKCATLEGFCPICGVFVLGSDDDWPLDSYGCCAECLDEIKSESGEYDGYDADDWDFYPAAWYDPDSDISQLEPPETPTGRYIGLGSEYESDSGDA